MNTYLTFIKKLTYKYNGKQLLLKNPANTARIPLLKHLFPNAKYIHIYRNPYNVYSSMKKFMRIVVPRYCLQRPPNMEKITKNILENYRALYEQFQKDKSILSSNELYEVRYEDFIKDPLPLIKEIYERFQIDRYSTVKPSVEAYIRKQKSFKTDEYNLSNVEKERVYKETKQVFDDFGYLS